MSAAREDIIGGIRRALGRGALPADSAADLEQRVAAHRRNLIPARAAALDHAGRIDLFVAMAEAVQTTIAQVAGVADVPAEIARYLAAENLPAELVMAPDPALDAIPWSERPLLRIRHGKAEADDLVSLTPCLAAIAETGTLMLVSGPDTPTTLNFLPDTQIVVLRAGQVVASYEDGWDLVRARGPLPNPPPLAGEGTNKTPPPLGEGTNKTPTPLAGEGRVGAKAWPRTVNLITGPSRTGDIEQRIQLGAHGPRRLHVVLIDAPAEAADGPAVG